MKKYYVLHNDLESFKKEFDFEIYLIKNEMYIFWIDENDNDNYTEYCFADDYNGCENCNSDCIDSELPPINYNRILKMKRINSYSNYPHK